jgi:predicted dinucleotide-binding enzyme
MKVAIIGAGNVGKALGRSIAAAGHDVVLASTGQSATDAAKEIGGKAAGASVPGAVRGADIVVFAVPYSAAGKIASAIASEVAGKIVIDVTNPLAPDMRGLATEPGTSGAEQLAQSMPDAVVVKAFNTLFASVQGNARAHGERLDALFATDDSNAREKVGALIEAMGFRPVWVGGLARARQLEELAFLNITLQMAVGGAWNTAFNLVGAPAAALDHRVPAGVRAK